MNRPRWRPNSASRPIPSAFPERSLRFLNLRGLDDDPVVGDLKDSPGRRTEGEAVAEPPLEHELLVEFAEAGVPVRENKGVESAVRNRPSVQDGDVAGSGKGMKRVAVWVERDAGAQAGEAAIVVSSGDEIDDAPKLVLRETPIGIGAACDGEKVFDGSGAGGNHRDDLLGEHVQRMLGNLERGGPSRRAWRGPSPR